MASGSIPPSSSSKSKSEESPNYDFMADTKWWLHPQPNDNSNFWEPSWEIEDYAKIKEFKASQKKPQDDHLIISENPKKLLSEMEPQLIGINKTEPWWRTAESLEHFYHFDPPRARVNEPGQRVVPDKGLASLDHVSNLVDSVGMSETFSPCGVDNPLSNTIPDEPENLQKLTKTELLEALCHSQTRARKAEKAAQQAYNEKQHMITHFLKQASHLFAYKQWFHILQLETTCLHLKNNKCHLVYTRFPEFVPWVPTKYTKWVRHKSAKMKNGKSFGRFILGLTLVGAGLLLGWTLGWLFR